MAPLTLSIVIPTYREAENLPVLIPRIDAACSESGLTCEILVIDDNSRDGTLELCQELSVRHPVKLFVREDERGLSSAVVKGMQLAQGEFLLVMDADLSHPPEQIPALIAALRQSDVDFVIGSRYVAGGSTDSDWSLFRWVNSKVATLLAWPLTSAHDPMAGFFALRRQRFLDHQHALDPIGYKIGLELIVKCQVRRVVEVPISFADRLHGESKLTLREQLNYLRHLKRLYENRYREASYLMKFGLVGASGMVVDLTTFVSALTLFPPAVARAVAIWVAMTWNFGGNRMLTFADHKRREFWSQYVSYCLSCLVGAVVNWGVSVALWNFIPGLNDVPWIPPAIGVLAGMGFNYTLCRLWVFRRGDESPSEPGQQDSSPRRSQYLNAA